MSGIKRTEPKPPPSPRRDDASYPGLANMHEVWIPRLADCSYVRAWVPKWYVPDPLPPGHHREG